MYNYTVQEGQNMVDIAVQEYGDPSSVIKIAQLNNLGIGDRLTAGQVLKLDADTEPSVPLIREFFANRKTIIATGAAAYEPEPDVPTARRFALPFAIQFA
jgi:hypothetical protein